METILSSHSLCPVLNPKSSNLQSKPSSLALSKTICSSLKKQPVKQSLSAPTNWFSHVQNGLVALAISLALNYSPILPNQFALASEFNVLNDGPPQESYVIDDAGVLSKVTKSDLKRLLSDLESRKGYHINVVTVRKLTYADQVLEKWYPTVEEGSNKGIVVLVTSQKEGAITGGPEFVKTVGDTVLDSTVSENLPGDCSVGLDLQIGAH